MLKSEKLNRFCIGATKHLVEVRLEQHLKKHFGTACFTAKSDDWEVFHVIECRDFTQALNIEKHIKRMKSKKYIENLKMYPDISTKLIEKYP